MLNVFSGVTLNIISLSGLALGVGMLVDNSIVVIENIYRMRNEGRASAKAAIEGHTQVSGAILASTLTTVCVPSDCIYQRNHKTVICGYGTDDCVFSSGESSDAAYDRTYDVSWCVAENGGKNKRFSTKYRTYTEIFWKKR